MIPTLGDMPFLELFCDSVEENSLYLPYAIMIWDNSNDSLAKEFAEKRGYYYIEAGENRGLAQAYSQMSKAKLLGREAALNEQKEVLFFADDDFVAAPGWDIAAVAAHEHQAWVSPNRVQNSLPTRSIIAEFGGQNPGTFNKDRFYTAFHHKRDCGFSIRHTFYPMFVPADDYQAIGRHNEELFLGEQDFIWRAYQYYQKQGKTMVNHPSSYVYHFKYRENSRPVSAFGTIEEDRARLKPDHGFDGDEMDRVLDHYRQHYPDETIIPDLHRGRHRVLV